MSNKCNMVIHTLPRAKWPVYSKRWQQPILSTRWQTLGTHVPSMSLPYCRRIAISPASTTTQEGGGRRGGPGGGPPPSGEGGKEAGDRKLILQ